MPNIGRLALGVQMLAVCAFTAVMNLYGYRQDAEIRGQTRERCDSALVQYDNVVENLKAGSAGSVEFAEMNRQTMDSLLDDYVRELEQRQSQARSLTWYTVAIVTFGGLINLWQWRKADQLRGVP